MPASIGSLIVANVPPQFVIRNAAIFVQKILYGEVKKERRSDDNGEQVDLRIRMQDLCDSKMCSR